MFDSPLSFSMNHFLKFLCLFFALLGKLQANSEIRTWKLSDGNSITGEIVSVNEDQKLLVLRDQQGKEISVSTSMLANLDRAWLTEWIEMNEELAAQVVKLGGRFQRHEGKGEKHTTGFYVYEPSARVKSGEAGPLMMLFCPSGKPVRYLLRHIEAAEVANITLVSADYFRNGLPFDEYGARFKDVYPLIGKTVKFNQEQFFLGGTSGGALGAFRLSADFPEIKVAGIYSNGGWLGYSADSKRPYPTMRVALVNGDKDHAANGYNDSVTKTLQERSCTVGMFAFEGAHQIPPASVQGKSFRWLLGEFE
jgi:hypothetical protein